MSISLKRETLIQKPAAAGDAARVRELMRKIRERMLKVQHRNDPAIEEEAGAAGGQIKVDMVETPTLLKLANSINGQLSEQQQAARGGPGPR